MRRFFVDPTAIASNEAMLDEAESRHLSRVLRLGKNDRVVLFDGRGAVYEGVILEIGNRARVQILSRREDGADNKPSGEPLDRQFGRPLGRPLGRPFGGPLVIVQAILRGQKMDELAQRYTELGVDTLITVWTNRCQGSFDALKESERQARQLRIIEAACKQSGRPRPLRLESPKNFADFLADSAEDASGWRRLMFWEDEETTSLHDVSFAGVEGVVALIGPAGGWTPEEAAMARLRGFCTVRLAGHILRAETAGLAVAALCQFLLRNL